MTGNIGVEMTGDVGVEMTGGVGGGEQGVAKVVCFVHRGNRVISSAARNLERSEKIFSRLRISRDIFFVYRVWDVIVYQFATPFVFFLHAWGGKCVKLIVQVVPRTGNGQVFLFWWNGKHSQQKEW